MLKHNDILALASREVMACHDLKAALALVDFKALHDVEDFGEPGYALDNGVATIKIRGLLVPETGYDLTAYGLTGYDVIAKYVENANEQGADSIVLDVNSGGGFVSGLTTAQDAIANSGIPVNTYASGNMASSAYWLGCMGQVIHASENSNVGSIGVYLEHFDESKALENAGVKYSIFKSGFWKGAFSSLRPLSEKESERLQSEVEQTADIFFEHVSSHRGITAKVVAKFDGDYFTAAKALESGLIDHIMENQKMTDKQTPGSAAQSNVSEAAATFTQADIDAAVKMATDQAVAQATAAALAFNERNNAINAHATASNEVKAMLAGDAFQGVAGDKLAALMDILPKSALAQMEDAAGAGIQADRNEFAPKSAADEKVEKQEAALAKLAGFKGNLV